jgi:Na+-translocating ferredoxin:NAD+ oxidoreductase RnfD subunit
VSTAPRATVDTRPPHRLVRALVLTGAAVAVGAAAHLLGGAAVDPLALAAAFPVLLGLSWPLTDRERGWLPIAGAQLAGQQVVHTLLNRAGDAVAPGLPVDVFLYGHVLAAVLMAVWLRRGEQRTWAAARRAARMVAACWARLVVLLGHVELPYPVATSIVASPVPLPGRPLLRHALVRRGPPVDV